MRPVLILLALSLPSLATAQSTFTETFDTGNEGAWNFGPPAVIEATGGNPSAYLYEPLLDTFAPQPRTTADSVFSGDYRARDVSSVSVDLITYDAGTTGGRPLSIMLYFDNGTAGVDDDFAAYFMHANNIPAVGAGWQTYTFDIPAQETSLPAGWGLWSSGAPGVTPDWNVAVQNVTSLRFFYGNPEYFFIFQQWELGLDNPSITEAGSTNPIFVRGDCNADGAIDIGDPVSELQILFTPGTDPSLCDSACDANDDGGTDISDTIYLLSFLFSTGPAIPAPVTCGEDPTVDTLTCNEFDSCP